MLQPVPPMGLLVIVSKVLHIINSLSLLGLIWLLKDVLLMGLPPIIKVSVSFVSKKDIQSDSILSSNNNGSSSHNNSTLPLITLVHTLVHHRPLRFLLIGYLTPVRHTTSPLIFKTWPLISSIVVLKK